MHRVKKPDWVVFFFFMGGIYVERPLKLDFTRTRCAMSLLYFVRFYAGSERGVKPPHFKATAATENIRVN
jgi:hypothetical protein